MTELIKIEVSQPDAALFLQFQKYYAFMLLLDKAGAFNLKSASLTLNFNSEGEIGSWETHEHHRLQ